MLPSFAIRRFAELRSVRLAFGRFATTPAAQAAPSAASRLRGCFAPTLRRCAARSVGPLATVSRGSPKLHRQFAELGEGFGQHRRSEEHTSELQSLMRN